MPDALSKGVLMLTYLAMEAVVAKANDMDVHNHGCRIRESPFGIDALEPLFSDFELFSRVLSGGRKEEDVQCITNQD